MDNASAQAVGPFLRWAGGKRWLLPLANGLRPERFDRYIEPFLGSAALFFALRPGRAYLSDKNADLIETYQTVAQDAASVVAKLRRMRYDSDFFYAQRAARPRSASGRAARFIYLNRTAWNGLYRVNRDGHFNVPFGTFTNPLANVRDRVLEAGETLAGVRLEVADFDVALRRARPKDFVYLDPPYVSAHKNNGFLRYNARVFSWDDQLRLSRMVRELVDRGVFVLMSNADHPSISRLYPDLRKHRITRKSLVAGSNDYRGAITELLFSNYRLGLKT